MTKYECLECYHLFVEENPEKCPLCGSEDILPINDEVDCSEELKISVDGAAFHTVYKEKK